MHNLSSLGRVIPRMGLIPINFLVTSLYDKPQGSLSICLQRLIQQIFLLFPIAYLTSFLAVLNSSFSFWKGSPLHRPLLILLRVAWHFLHRSSISFVHQCIAFFPPLYCPLGMLLLHAASTIFDSLLEPVATFLTSSNVTVDI